MPQVTPPRLAKARHPLLEALRVPEWAVREATASGRASRWGQTPFDAAQPGQVGASF